MKISPSATLFTSMRGGGTSSQRKSLNLAVVTRSSPSALQETYFLVRLLPYRTSENVIDGIILSIVDIDRLKRSEEEYTRALKIFESVVQTVRQPVLVLDSDLRVVKSNDSFSMTFQTSESETEGKLIYELGNGRWDIPELRRLLEEILPNRTLMTDYRVHHSFPDIGSQTFLLNARQLKAARKPNPELIFLSFERVLEETS